MVTAFPKVSIVNGTFSVSAGAKVTGGGGASGTDFLPQEARQSGPEERATAKARFIRWLGRWRTTKWSITGIRTTARASLCGDISRLRLAASSSDLTTEPMNYSEVLSVVRDLIQTNSDLKVNEEKIKL